MREAMPGRAATRLCKNDDIAHPPRRLKRDTRLTQCFFGKRPAGFCIAGACGYVFANLFSSENRSDRTPVELCVEGIRAWEPGIKGLLAHETVKRD
jgi:hypothetical protein